MKSDNIFKGNINYCSRYIEGIGCREFRVYKENATLILRKDGRYIDLDSLNKLEEIISVYLDPFYDNLSLERKNLSNVVKSGGQYYVDLDTLKPLFEDKKSVSLIKLKKSL